LTCENAQFEKGGAGSTKESSAQIGKKPDMTAQPNIVLVHGAWADGSSWSAVIQRLQADGYRVTAPQFPMTGLACWRIRPRVGRDILPGQTSVGEEVS
jgi:pimeloyl-ACP methyl ester carboxylesterase